MHALFTLTDSAGSVPNSARYNDTVNQEVEPYKMASNTALVVLLVLACAGLQVAEAYTCYSAESYYTYYGSLRYRSTNEYCASSDDCCDIYGLQASCDCGSSYYYISTVYTTISTGAIVGIVIGSLAGTGIFIAIIVCLCCACCNSGRRTQGQVMVHQPAGATVVSTHNVTTATHQAYPQPVNVGQGAAAPYPGGYNPSFVPDGQQAGMVQPPPYTNKY